MFIPIIPPIDAQSISKSALIKYVDVKFFVNSLNKIINSIRVNEMKNEFINPFSLNNLLI